MRLGIMQGRLVASATGALDCPPGPRWRDEFDIAGSLGLHHIELVAEKAFDAANPLWSDRPQLTATAGAAGVRLASLCVNEPLVHPFDGDGVATELAARLVPVVRELGIEVVVVPLLEESDLAVLDRRRVTAGVRELADGLGATGARLALEVGAPAPACRALLADTDHPAVGLCYDVGNATALGLDAAAELRELASDVVHVHAKDKDAAGQNVRFGTGLVPFGPVVAALGDLRYEGLVTMEATRGDDPVVTAAEHRDYLLALEAAT